MTSTKYSGKIFFAFADGLNNLYEVYKKCLKQKNIKFIVSK